MSRITRERGNLHDRLVEKWGLEIVSGELPAGHSILTNPAADELGVSRSVVREAVRVLESKGLVRVRRRVGITVETSTNWSSLDSDIIRWNLAGPDRFTHLDHLCSLRTAIEPLAAQLAATAATPEQCGLLTEAVIGMSKTARSADTDAYLEHDAEFHRILLQASGNPLFGALSDVVIEMLAGRTRHGLMPQVAATSAVQLHGEVAASVQAGDGAVARKAMQGILDETETALHLASGTELPSSG
ncbi:FCD domain-containing protein [Pseudonocardia sp. NPDC046786]|uniref:FadR/GntR family transcriptional regulator n=1 Tax=Pseudonocardia sp. NPDC046786 TaxID=3155471 RepID=UPI0033D174D6